MNTLKLSRWRDFAIRAAARRLGARRALSALSYAKVLTVETVMGASRAWRRFQFKAAAARKPIVLFLVPEAGLAPFMAGHVLLARSLQESGERVVLLSCRGLQPICSMKFSLQMAPTSAGDEENTTCKFCRASATTVGHEYKLPDITLESLLDVEARRKIDQIIARCSERLWTLSWDGIDFGAVGLGEVLRDRRKVSVDELNDQDLALLRAVLYSSLALHFAVTELARRFNIARIAYFGDYAHFIGPMVFAQKHGIALTNISHAYNGDIDQRYLLLRPGFAIGHMLGQVERWGEYRNVPLSQNIIDSITDRALFRLRGQGGSTTYSPNWNPSAENLLVELGLDLGKKTLVVFPSSMDEVVSLKEFARILEFPYQDQAQPFAGQEAWLAALMKWVGSRADLQMIIRVHPRVGNVSGRHSGISTQLAQVQRDLASPPPNVAVVPADSPISSYNLGELADVVLIAWSSLGLELARFGTPVLAAFQRTAPFPTGTFIKFEDSKDGYFAALEQCLSESGSIEHIAEALRWTHYLHWSCLVDVSDVVPSPTFSRVPPYRPLKSRALISEVLSSGKSLEKINMDLLGRSAADVARERAAVFGATRRVIAFFMGIDLPIQHLQIVISDKTEDAFLKASDAGIACLHIASNDLVSLTIGNVKVQRFSKLVARLGRIIARSAD